MSQYFSFTTLRRLLCPVTDGVIRPVSLPQGPREQEREILAPFTDTGEVEPSLSSFIFKKKKRI